LCSVVDLIKIFFLMSENFLQWGVCVASRPRILILDLVAVIDLKLTDVCK
jgi:hypothetical protein